MVQKKTKTKTKFTVEFLPFRDTVIFPGQTIAFFIGRESSLATIRAALSKKSKLLILTQKNSEEDNPRPEDIYRVGVYGEILQTMEMGKNKVKVMFSAVARYKADSLKMTGKIYSAEVVRMESVMAKPSEENKVLIKKVLEYAITHFKTGDKRMDMVCAISAKKVDPEFLVNLLTPFLENEVPQKQKIFEIENVYAQLEMIYRAFLETEKFKIAEKKLKERVHKQIGKSQKEYYLNEQMKAIKKELGEGGSSNELEILQKRISSSKMSKEAKETAEKEIKKLTTLSPMSAEGNIIRSYLDWLISIPWSKRTKDNPNLKKAEAILNRDHYGLEKVKERIIEHIAVVKQVGKIKGPILCLVGPPGVGKTSLAKSVARALGRNFARISLGGIRDEAEIRGHRRTYIGAMPGKIIQTIKKTKYKNPLILLDEVDKMVSSAMGNPSSALLEVLDPEQNNSFMDHYLEVEYDLSDVLFFCTANRREDIPEALYDRMEVIYLSGYTEPEKKMIFKKHLLNKQFKENGITNFKLKMSDAVILELIRSYTKEAGVRSLERLLAKICRKSLTKVLCESKTEKIQITKLRLKEYLGQPLYRFGLKDNEDRVGIATGLAWTQYGGDLLKVEVLEMPGKGSIQLTGKLGEVMKESGQAALSYIRYRANSLGIYSKKFKDSDLHIHVPEGATPKDGPSAGITLTTALVSALTKIPIKHYLAMTGEVTLQGNILPIGGLKEKLLAAKRGGIKEVIIPDENYKDLEEFPDEVKKDLKIIPMKNVHEVLSYALVSFPEAVDDADLEQENTTKILIPPAEEPEKQITGHY